MEDKINQSEIDKIKESENNENLDDFEKKFTDIVDNQKESEKTIFYSIYFFEKNEDPQTKELKFSGYCRHFVQFEEIFEKDGKLTNLKGINVGSTYLHDLSENLLELIAKFYLILHIPNEIPIYFTFDREVTQEMINKFPEYRDKPINYNLEKFNLKEFIDKNRPQVDLNKI
jgi:hypothetical protein